MKSSIISNYIIFWLHLINLTMRIYYELNEFEIIKLNMDNFNFFINDLFSVNYVFDDGVIDIITLITAIISFYLSKYYSGSLLNLIISTFIIEILLIYNNKNGKFLNLVLTIICFYTIGKLMRKNRNKYILEKNFENENIFDEVNIQEYEPYKLY